MIPPTPTPMPPGEPIPLNLQGEVSLWKMAPEMVGLWGQFSDYTPVLQWLAIAAVVIIIVWMVARLLMRLSEDDL